MSESIPPSALVSAATTPPYTVATTAWPSFPAHQAPSPLPYGDTLPVPSYGSGGDVYPSDTEWSAERNSYSHSPANSYDLSVHDGAPGGMSSHDYAGPEDPYQAYTYQADCGVPFAGGVVSSGSHRRSSRHSSVSSRQQPRYPLSPPSSTGRASKLRSASRASKNNHLNPPATEEERKTRASHNQVEKQYRNRLNAHFEALLNTLPEYMRGGEDEEVDIDRKISKAEVLEMARRHILSLERDCSALQEERDDLRASVEKMRWDSGKCLGGPSLMNIDSEGMMKKRH